MSQIIFGAFQKMDQRRMEKCRLFSCKMQGVQEFLPEKRQMGFPLQYLLEILGKYDKKFFMEKKKISKLLIICSSKEHTKLFMISESSLTTSMIKNTFVYENKVLLLFPYKTK